MKKQDSKDLTLDGRVLTFGGVPISANYSKNSTINPAGPLDKLAQLTEFREETPEFSKFEHVLLTKKNLQKRARAKYITNSYLSHLATLNSPLAKSYKNSLFCTSVMLQTKDVITSTFCKNRWCLVCARIRTAQLIQAYLPVIKTWENKAFLTLTIPNVSGDSLQYEMQSMYENFRDINKKLRHKKGATKADFAGLRKLECTYNPTRKDYHPHFHVLLNNGTIANTFLKEWLKKYPSAKEAAQDVRAADDNTVKEMFKYFTKILTKQSNGTKIFVKPLDNIFCSMRGKRIFQPFGFTADEPEHMDSELVEECLEVDKQTVWQWVACDWVDMKTGELLSEYTPSQRIMELSKQVHLQPE